MKGSNLSKHEGLFLYADGKHSDSAGGKGEDARQQREQRKGCDQDTAIGLEKSQVYFSHRRKNRILH